MEVPPVTVNEAPAALADDPTAILTEPALPDDAFPVVITMLPVPADADDPVFTSTEPEEPTLATEPVCSTKNPLPLLALLPVINDTAPPSPLIA